MSDINVTQTEGKTIPLTFVDENGDAVDLTNATMSFRLAQNFSDGALIAKDHDDFDMTDAVDGIVYFDLDIDETNLPAGTYLGQGKAYWTDTNSDLTRIFIIAIDPALAWDTIATWNASEGITAHTHQLTAGATDVIASADELNYVDGVTSAIQTQLDSKVSNTGDTISGDLAVTGTITSKVGRAATLVIAANDSSDLDKAQADYVGDGTGDQVEIAAAISAGTPGTIVLAEGTYDIASDLTIPATVTLQFANGALFDITSGKTVTFNGRLDAGLQQIFSGDGSVTLPLGTTEYLYPEWWGAIGDGSTDDIAAVQDAIDAWIINKGELILTAQYKITSSISATISSHSVFPMTIRGGELISALSSGYMLAFDGSAYEWRNLIIKNLKFTGGSAEDGALSLQAQSGGHLYHFSVDGVIVHNLKGHGVHLVQNVFEGIVKGGKFQLDAADTTHYGVYLSSSTVTSIDLIGINTRYGKYGVYADSAEVDIHGGTYLLAQEYGVYINGAYGNTYSGLHVENNWESAADINSGDAGLYVSGHSFVINGVYGTTSSKQKYAVKIYIATGENATVIGGHGGGSTVNFAKVDGGDGARAILVGVQSYEKAYNPDPAKMQVTEYSGRLRLRGGISLPHISKTGNYTLTTNDYAVSVDATSASITITLPSAAEPGGETTSGKRYLVKRIDSSGNDVIVAGTIDGVTNYKLRAQWEFVEVMSDGTNWITASSCESRQQHSFMQSDVAANQSAVALDILGLAGNTEVVMPYAGSVVGISIASNDTRAAGTLTVDATINGTVTGLQAVLDASNIQYHSATQAKDSDAFAAGDRIGIKITTDASWLPVTADIIVTVIVEM